MLQLKYSDLRFLTHIGQCRDVANNLADRRHPVQTHHFVYDGEGQLTMSTTDGRVAARSTVPVSGKEPAWQCAIDAFGWNALRTNKADVFSLTHTPDGSRLGRLRVNANIDYQAVGRQKPVIRRIERSFRHQPVITTERYDCQPNNIYNQPIVAEDLRKALDFVLGHHAHSQLTVERASERERVCSWFADGQVMSAEKGVMRVARLAPPPFPITINRHNAALLAKWLAVVTPVCLNVVMAREETPHGTPVTWFTTSCGRHHFWITAAQEVEFARHFVDRRLEGDRKVEMIVHAKYLRSVAEILSHFSNEVRATLLNEDYLQIECVAMEPVGQRQPANEVMMVTSRMDAARGEEIFRANGTLLAKMVKACEISGFITLRLTVRGEGRILVLQQADELDGNNETYPLVMMSTRSPNARL